MSQKDRFIDSKHPFHMFLNILEINPESSLTEIEFLANSWTVCPLFNQALQHIFKGSDQLYKTLAKFRNTDKFWEEHYSYYWNKINNRRKKPQSELEKILNKFMKELGEYNKRKNHREED